MLDLENQERNAGAALGDLTWGIEIVRGSRQDDGLFGNPFRNVLKGNDGDDTLFGRGGTDRLIGGRGDDHLKGGLDDDRMTGGDGADVFIFRAGDGDDVVFDFTALEDVIRFQGVTTYVVSNDGTDTVIDYGSGTITLSGVVLDQADITFDFV